MTRRDVLVALLATASTLGCHNTSSGSASTESPRRLVNRLWAISYEVREIPLGDVTVSRNGRDFGRQQISLQDFKEVEAWAKLGLISLKSEDVLSENKAFNWEDWIAGANVTCPQLRSQRL